MTMPTMSQKEFRFAAADIHLRRPVLLAPLPPCDERHVTAGAASAACLT
jgi:hypothetical protein